MRKPQTFRRARIRETCGPTQPPTPPPTPLTPPQPQAAPPKRLAADDIKLVDEFNFEIARRFIKSCPDQQKRVSEILKMYDAGHVNKPSFPVEGHHQLPRCTGGYSGKTSNLLYFTPKDHFVIHVRARNQIQVGGARAKRAPSTVLALLMRALTISRAAAHPLPCLRCSSLRPSPPTEDSRSPPVR